jgi:hypothetical protein
MKILIANLTESDEAGEPPVYEYELSNIGRLILHTIHGTVYIDVRENDVNAFSLQGGRKDYLLIPKV